MVLTRRQLTEESQVRATILATYLCPVGHTLTFAPVECLFGHRPHYPATRSSRGRWNTIAVPQATPDNLRPVPEDICVDYISGGICANPTNDSTVRCIRGFHPTVDELVDLDAYLHRVNQQSQGQEIIIIDDDVDDTSEVECDGADSVEIIDLDETLDSAESEDTNHQNPETCNLCFEEFVGVYALLESCDHYFCPPCIKRWFNQQRNNGTNTNCPNCRTRSDRILFWPSIIRDQAEKERMFNHLD